MDVLNSSNGLINGGLTNNWYMTLGASNTLTFVNFNAGDTLTLRLTQDGTGSRTVTWPSTVVWQSGQAPTLKTAANAVDVFTLNFDGTNWRDVGGSASRLPQRVTDVGLGTIIGAGVVALTLVVSGGNGQRPGATGLSDVAQYQTGTGSTKVTVAKVTASGAFVTGQSGALVVGSPTLNPQGTDYKFLVKPSGMTIARSTVSGSQLTVNPPSASTGYLLLGGAAKGSAICLYNNAGTAKKITLNNAGTDIAVGTPAAGECVQ